MRPSGASTLNGSGMTAHVSLWHAATQAWGTQTTVESAQPLGRALLAPRIRAGVAPTLFARQHPGIQKFGLSLTGPFGTSLLTAKHKYSKLLANGMVRSFQAIRDQP